MIKSKEDFKYYLEADRIAIGEVDRRKPRLFTDELWRFQILLRKLEYYHNCKRFWFYKPYYFYLRFKFKIFSIILGFSIPLNVFGPGLFINHRGTIVIYGGSKIGANCRIHACINIGLSRSDIGPELGDNVYIGPGAKIFGPIKIADGIAIGANSVVNKSFYEKNISIGGIPAKKISDIGSEGLLRKATEILDRIPKSKREE